MSLAVPTTPATFAVWHDLPALAASVVLRPILPRLDLFVVLVVGSGHASLAAPVALVALANLVGQMLLWVGALTRLYSLRCETRHAAPFITS